MWRSWAGVVTHSLRFWSLLDVLPNSLKLSGVLLKQHLCYPFACRGLLLAAPPCYVLIWLIFCWECFPPAPKQAHLWHFTSPVVLSQNPDHQNHCGLAALTCLRMSSEEGGIQMSDCIILCHVEPAHQAVWCPPRAKAYQVEWLLVSGPLSYPLLSN